MDYTQTKVRLAFISAKLGYVVVLALATLTALQFDPDVSEAMNRLARAFYPSYTPRDMVDAVRNLALFAGWGALWVVTSPPTRISAALTRPLLTGAALSIGIETLQLFSPVRSAMLLDVITNTAGALSGALLVVVMVEIARLLRERKSYLGIPALSFAATYFVAILFQAVVLTRSDPLPGVYGGPLTRFRATMAHFQLDSITALPLADALLFFPLGAFVVAALVELGRKHGRAAWQTTAGGVVLSVAAEVTRGALALPIELGAIVVHFTAIALGALAAARWLPVLSRRLRGRRRPRALAGTYAVILALWSWKPFLLETDPRVILSQLSLTRLVPLQAHGWRVDLFSVADIGGPFFLYLPLGGLLAVWPLRRRGPLGYCLPAVYLAALTELGQVIVAGRYFGITDVIVQCAAVAIGWTVIGRAGFHPYGEMLAARTRPG